MKEHSCRSHGLYQGVTSGPEHLIFPQYSVVPAKVFTSNYFLKLFMCSIEGLLTTRKP